METESYEKGADRNVTGLRGEGDVVGSFAGADQAFMPKADQVCCTISLAGKASCIHRCMISAQRLHVNPGYLGLLLKC